MGMQDDYRAQVEKQFAEWQAQAERFKETAAQMETQARAQFEQSLELLRQTQTQAWDNLSKLKQHHESTWNEFKAHMEKAGAELHDAAEAMTRGFKA